MVTIVFILIPILVVGMFELINLLERGNEDENYL